MGRTSRLYTLQTNSKKLCTMRDIVSLKSSRGKFSDVMMADTRAFPPFPKSFRRKYTETEKAAHKTIIGSFDRANWILLRQLTGSPRMALKVSEINPMLKKMMIPKISYQLAKINSQPRDCDSTIPVGVSRSANISMIGKSFEGALCEGVWVDEILGWDSMPFP